MKQTVSFYDFERAFRDYGREDNFSYEALRALFDYYEEYEQATDTHIELDVIAICCEWTEYDTIEDIEQDYQKGFTSIEDIEQYTTAIQTENGSILVIDF